MQGNYAITVLPVSPAYESMIKESNFSSFRISSIGLTVASTTISSELVSD